MVLKSMTTSLVPSLPFMLFLCVVGATFKLARVQSGGSGIPRATLSNGVQMPFIAAGLWEVTPAEALAMVPMALRIGFNHIDASIFYGNQREVGDALKQWDRADYFITTKVDPNGIHSGPEAHHAKGPVHAMTPVSAYNETMRQLFVNLREDLRLSQLDLALVHWPAFSWVGLSDEGCATMRETWRAMEDFYKSGLARAIGVSNYCPSSFECILPTSRIPPMVNQVQYHLGMGPDPGGIKTYCEAHGIQLQAYSPLGAGTSGSPRTAELISGELVTSIGAKYGKTGAQVSLRWVVQNGIPLAAESTNEAHLKADLDIFDFELSAEDMARLNTLTQPRGMFSFACRH
jgi:diketogulonate reductase-like aldo/keto reductase